MNKMAAESGRSDLALAHRALERQLTEKAVCFEFFQAVRPAGAHTRGRSPVGLFAIRATKWRASALTTR